MTTIDGRITKLEDAFGNLIPLLETIIETLNGHTGKLDGHTGKLDGHTGKLDAIIATQAEHTALLNQHSIELELIKGYLG